MRCWCSQQIVANAQVCLWYPRSANSPGLTYVFWKAGRRRQVYCNQKKSPIHHWLCDTSCSCILFQLRASKQVGNTLQSRLAIYLKRCYFCDLGMGSQTTVKHKRAACFVMYLLNTFVDMNSFLVYCAACEKWGATPWTHYKRFVNYWYNTLLNCGNSMKECTVQPTNMATFLAIHKVTTFVWYSAIVTETKVFNQVKTFSATLYMTASSRPGLDPPLL